MRIHTAIRFVAICTLLAATAIGCSSDEEGFLPTIPDPNDDGGTQERDPIPATDFLLSARVESTPANYVDAELIAGTTTAPTVYGAHQIVRGGSIVLEVTIEDTAEALLFGVNEADVGYFRLDLSSLSASPRVLGGLPDFEMRAWKTMKSTPGGVQAAVAAPTTLVLSVTSQSDPGMNGFTLQVATLEAGAISAVTNHIVAVHQEAASSSTLQFSLNWTQPVDLDLHVQLPSGEYINFANTVGPNGGVLDLDSNAACQIDNINNENITWADNQPAVGTYTLYVDLWSACELAGPFPYVATWVVDGEIFTQEGTYEASDASTHTITTVTLQ